MLHRVAFNCFLCGATLNRVRDHARQDTNEDVYPRWLQRRYDLADLDITLSDGRTKKYSEVLVPACRECNNVYLSGVEDRISRAVNRGFHAFGNLPKHLVFLWCAKVYYGLVHLEVQPRDGTSKAPERPSLPPHFLDDLGWVLRLLQGFRKRVIVEQPQDLPFSVLRFPLQVGKDESYYFQARHTTQFPGIALQMGRVGVICVFDDFQAMERRFAATFGAALDGHALHPVQFWELAGILLYSASLYSYHTQFVLMETEHDIWIKYMPIQDREGEFSDRDAAVWAQKLSMIWARFLTGDSRGMQFYDPTTEKRITTLVEPNGTFNELPVDDEMP